MYMRYVVLLRGINVGGRNKIAMPELESAVVDAGYADVSTYINTGNIFLATDKPQEQIAQDIERIIQDAFGLDIYCLVRSKSHYDLMMNDIPDHWANDKDMKSDVMFLWSDVDGPEVLNQLPRTAVDTVMYSNGAVLWNVDRASQSTSGQLRLAGKKIYKQMTIRNVNTARTIATML